MRKLLSLGLLLVAHAAAFSQIPDMTVLRYPRNDAAIRGALQDAPEADTHPGQLPGDNDPGKGQPFTLGFENPLIGKAGQVLCEIRGGVVKQIVPPTDPAKLAEFQAIVDQPVATGCVIYQQVDKNDAGSVLFVWMHAAQEYFRGWKPPAEGSDIYRYRFSDGKITRLTTQEVHDRDDAQLRASLGRDRNGNIIWPKIYNHYPYSLSNGDIGYVTNRYGYTSHTHQPMKEAHFHKRMGRLTLMDKDGRNIRDIGWLNMGHHGAINVRQNPWTGQIGFMSSESSGPRWLRGWSFWKINPDGTSWGPYLSGFERQDQTGADNGFNWSEFTPNRNIVGAYYYGQKNKGYGNLYRFKFDAPHGKADARQNAQLRNNGKQFGPFPFQPDGMDAPVGPLLDWEDTTRNFGRNIAYTDAELAERMGNKLGKASSPAAAPGNKVLVSFAKFYGGGSSFTMVTGEIWSFDDAPGSQESSFKPVLKDPNFWYWQASPIATWEQIYNTRPPVLASAVGSKAQTWGYFGSSGVDERQSSPESQFNEDGAFGSRYGDTVNRTNQGAWGAGGDTIHMAAKTAAERLGLMNAKVKYIRVVSQYSNRYHQSHPNGFKVWGGEIWGRIGDLPIGHKDSAGNEVKYNDGSGQRDTSFLVKLPANSPWVPQLLDENKRVLVHSFTWHQTRPVEFNTSCNGCHQHTGAGGRKFPGTFADLNRDKVLKDWSKTKARIVEWNRDIKPILQSKCASCHSEGGEAAGVWVLDDSLRDNTNLVWPMHSIRSKLLSSIIDGSMPKAGGTPVTAAERELIAQWIDSGMPVGAGAFTDQEPPIVNVTSPQPNAKASQIRLAAWDRQSDVTKVEVSIDKAIAGPNGQMLPAGTLLSMTKGAANGDEVWSYDLGGEHSSGSVTVRVFDSSGNIYRQIVTMGTGEAPDPGPVDPPPTDPDDCKAQLAALKAELEKLKQRVTELEGRITKAKSALDGN